MTDVVVQDEAPEPEPETMDPAAGEVVAMANSTTMAQSQAAESPFAPLSVNGAAVDLTHLHEFSFTFDTGKRQGVMCFVTFSTHCFSDKYDPDRHPAKVTVFDDRGVERCFDQERYDLSKGLRALLAGLPGTKVYQTPEANFAIITTRSGREYRVFFNVRKMEQKKRLRLYVESAYSPDSERAIPAPVTAYQRVKFNLLCDTILDGKPAKFHGR